MKFERAQFPALSAFLRGYLHEDAALTYGNAAGAARAFLAEVTAGERQQVADDLRRLWTSEILTVHAANEALAELGSRWQFGNADELAEVFGLLGAAPVFRK